MDIDSPSMPMAMPRNVREDIDKGTIGTRIIEAARAAVATVIGGGRGMEENVVVGVNSNQNTGIKCANMRTRRNCDRCDFFRTTFTTSLPHTAN